MPKALQDAYAACAIYSTKTPDNEFVAFNIIEAKASELLRSPNQASWNPLDLLAAVQSLLIFQFIRLFDGDIRQRVQAESAEPILDAWTDQLKTRTTEEQRYTTVTAPSWRSWIFAESARRTITMSIFLSGIYSLVKRGFCTLSDEVTANSFTAQRALWDASSQLEWERAKMTYNPLWVNKMNFDVLLQEAKGSELDDFGMVSNLSRRYRALPKASDQLWMTTSEVASECNALVISEIYFLALFIHENSTDFSYNLQVLMITYKSQDVVDHWLAMTNTDRNLVGAPNFHQSLLDMVQFADGSVTSSEPI